MKPAQRDPWRRVDAMAAAVVIALVLATLCADLLRLVARNWRNGDGK